LIGDQYELEKGVTDPNKECFSVNEGDPENEEYEYFYEGDVQSIYYDEDCDQEGVVPNWGYNVGQIDDGYGEESFGSESFSSAHNQAMGYQRTRQNTNSSQV
jgi:hypothetical protein